MAPLDSNGLGREGEEALASVPSSVSLVGQAAVATGQGPIG